MEKRARDIVVPNKLYFRIGEVSDLVGVKPYVLRYWESEFPDIKPTKSKSGQRLYKRRDVEMLVKIKELLYEERFTINGARKRLKDGFKLDVKEDVPPPQAVEPEVETKTPKQLEVFAAAEARVAKGRENVKTPISHDQTKTLLKIKKDLQTLLMVVKSE